MIRGAPPLQLAELAWAVPSEGAVELLALGEIGDAVELTSLAAPIDLPAEGRPLEVALLAPLITSDPRRSELGRSTQALQTVLLRLRKRPATPRGVRLRELLARILELRQAAGAQMSRITVG
jgi:hypothetical protein